MRGEGGYVLPPPSNHRSGRQHIRELAHHPEGCGILPGPAWLFDRILGRGWAADRRLPESIGEGTRNPELWREAWALARRRGSPDEPVAGLLIVNQRRSLPGAPEYDEALA